MTVAITLALDEAIREVAVPDELAAAMAGAGVRARFDALSFTNRRERCEAVAGAKRADTRKRRIAAIVAELAG